MLTLPGQCEFLSDAFMAEGRAFLRFDYLVHGESSGDFRDGTISRWRADALAALEALTEGPLVLVGSSMGGWISFLVAAVSPQRLHAMVLIAPAADFTAALMKPGLPPEAHEAIARDGEWIRPSLYEPTGYPITRGLLEDGARWTILGAPVPIDCPVRILQGREDPDVPWQHALELANAIKSEDVVFTLIKDGDHRLSRDQDIARLISSVEDVL